ncbi:MULTISPECIES: lactate racemase domain-containing protein [Sporomusa]|uniref:lactate racemase domain-containing protein n=1 Tax=Sporomusa TaxID=2375 RepID=UPI00166CC5E4|nr:lactate racemase domain-containing protein [Sporomusa sp. GT1]
MMPSMFLVHQKFSCAAINDIAGEVSGAFTQAALQCEIKAGQKIAVAVGSRGIANISTIVRCAINELKRLGADPFIVPAMGSHGGATAAGQTKVLASLGITAEQTGVPVVSSMEVILLGQTPDGVPVYLDKSAAEAEGIFLINRIKPHTDFDAPVESGLIKMIAIGLAKHKGCVAIHTHGLAKYIPQAADIVINKTNIIGGLAIIENSREKTEQLEVIRGSQLIRREPELLAKAKKLMARLPFQQLDLLIVRTMGKTISGTGMDTNVIGRQRVEGLPEPGNIAIKRIVVLDLMDDSYGNALGIGLADFTTQKLVDKIDFKTMYANVISTGYLERGKIPIYLSTEQETIETALKTIGPVKPQDAHICVIRNTLEMEELVVSASLLPAIQKQDNLEVIQEIGPLSFSDKGVMQLFFGN